MKKQHIVVPVVLLLALVWGAFSWRWYTCGVKGFCNDTTIVVPMPPETHELPTAETPVETPAVPEYSKPEYWVKG